MKKKWVLLIPLLIFIILAGFFVVGLNRNPREIPSPLIDKPVPKFSLPDFHTPDRFVTEKDFAGKIWLLNVWASWCGSCRDEHPILVRYAKDIGVPIVGLNYKDKYEDGQAWLKYFGDPYALSIIDSDGRFGIDLGVYGVPETFLIDQSGIIRLKHIGPITEAVMIQTILPKIKELEKQ